MPASPTFYTTVGKRLFDGLAAGVGLILLSPLLCLIALRIKISSPGPVLFRQIRMGRFGKPFTLYKFRSMVVDNKGLGVTQENDPRITPIGKWLRATKADELPQLWNVLVGDMSLVGPRPELERYTQTHAVAYAKVLTVRPGITDNAAIAFRNEEALLATYPDTEKAYIEIILPQKINLYLDYIQQVSFKTDLALIFKTLLKL
ncbi:MAG: sugar transferase [Candidatus Margulisiibacteriota bacterium]